jgi:hypothetical protein
LLWSTPFLSKVRVHGIYTPLALVDGSVFYFHSVRRYVRAAMRRQQETIERAVWVRAAMSLPGSPAAPRAAHKEGHPQPELVGLVWLGLAWRCGCLRCVGITRNMPGRASWQCTAEAKQRKAEPRQADTYSLLLWSTLFLLESKSLRDLYPLIAGSIPP